MTIQAIFFPVDPDADCIDMVNQANEGMRKGLRLYTDGRRFALMQKPAKGWAVFGSSIKPADADQPAAAAA